jgi:hypothetical protein
MTFNSLQDDLRAYLERGTSVDPTVFAELPSLINLAERDLAQSLKILGFQNVVTSTMGIGQSVYQKPDRWRDTININFGVGATQIRTPLFPRSYDYARQYWPDENLTDQPKFYADYAYFNWLFAPTPDAAYPFEVTYFELPALLDAGNQTNWSTDFAPNALLHGALVQASRFLKDDPRTVAWQATYDRDLGILEDQDIKRIIDRQVTRNEV